MRIAAAACAAVLLAAAVFLSRASEPAGIAEIARLDESNWAEFAPQGKEADAIYGDYVLRNKYLTAVVARPDATRHANMTVRDVAGALIDLTARDDQSDQLSAFYPGQRRYPYRAIASVQVDDSRAAFGDSSRLSGRSASLTVSAAGGENRPAVKTTYMLKADAPYLTMTTEFTNTGQKPLAVPLVDDIRADGRKEDMAKAPNGTARLFWIHDRYWNQAYGFEAPGLKVQSESNSNSSVLKYQQAGGADSVTLQPGQSFQLTRRLYAGRSLLDMKAAFEQTAGRKVYPAVIKLRDAEGRPVPRARIELSQSGTVRGTATANRQGVVKTKLPAGEFAMKVSALGVPIGGGNGNLTIHVDDRDEPQTFEFSSGGFRPGKVVARITDSAGNPIPCKVEFIAKEGTPQPDFGPETAEFAVRNLCYAPLGRFEQDLPAGRYDVIVSHGPEFDAVFTELTVPPAETVPLRARLVRSVDTGGWISSDFHSHSSPSGDNTSSQLGRVINLVCEHIEFAPCTEHNRISIYDPHIKRLGVQEFIATTPGIELTGKPLPLNHQNAFPLVYKPHRQDGGAPVTDVDPERQIERLTLWDNRSEKLVQQNHPDIGWLFYDRNGDGRPDGGYERSFPFIDVTEIHPVQHALQLRPVVDYRGRDYANRVFAWLQLLNQGYRIPGVVNTDAHYNFHGSGWLRNWIKSSTDDPSEIDPMEMVRSAEEGNLIMSNGPFLQVALRGEGKSATAGDDLAAPSGRVELDVRVQCANWLDVDHVFVLVNGRPHQVHDYTRDRNPDKFSGGVVKFSERLPLRLKEDAHLVVVAGREKGGLGSVVGPQWKDVPPTAVSNPIFVDVDGGGFRPNGDTLGHPLPVKFGTR